MGLAGSHDVARAGVAGRATSAVHRLDPRAKLVALLGVTVVAVATPLGLWPVWAVAAGVLGLYAAAAGVGPGTVWRRARLVLVPVLLVAALLPLLRGGDAVAAAGPLAITDAGLRALAETTARALIGTAAAVLLAATTPFPALLHGLEALRVPRLLVLVAAVMERYGHVVADEARRMHAASRARGYRPRSLRQAGTVGRLVAALFLRAHARGERVHLAMLSRGFTGSLPRLEPLRLTGRDAAFVLAVALALLPLRVGLGLA